MSHWLNEGESATFQTYRGCVFDTKKMYSSQSCVAMVTITTDPVAGPSRSCVTIKSGPLFIFVKSWNYRPIRLKLNFSETFGAVSCPCQVDKQNRGTDGVQVESIIMNRVHVHSTVLPNFCLLSNHWFVCCTAALHSLLLFFSDIAVLNSIFSLDLLHYFIKHKFELLCIRPSGGSGILQIVKN